MKILLILVLLIFIIPSSKQVNMFKSGDCVKWHFDKQIRKVIDTRLYLYKYCVIMDNECVGNYLMRKTIFNKIMKKTTCKETK